jgi:anaerobic selenocysteine-containing dehydrogenase/Fe-S-cluster-containing dehydrogenase component
MTAPSGSAGVKRRDFLKVLGAAGATTTAIGCSQERVEKLIPYLASPDQTVPGVSTYYATTCRECAAGCGLIAETRDGRVIKLEGNPAHPLNRGALCARGQSALQGLYNPDRYRSPMIRRNNALAPISWDDALRTFRERIAGLGAGAASAVFVNQHETGSFPAFLDQWLAGYGMPAHIAYDGEAPHAVLQANRQSYGVAWPALDFASARLIVAVGADFLDLWGASVPQQLAFADARAKLANAPRFVYIGPRRSLTGLNADEWIACKPGSELAIVNALAGRGGTMAEAATASGVDQAVLQRLAGELAATKPSLVMSGVSTVNALDVALAVNALNQAAGNVGVTIKPAEALTSFDRAGTPNELRDAVQRMASGAVQLAMFRGVNPVYTLPKALRVGEALARVPFKVSFSSYPDETSALCDLILPDDHSLESWGDAESARGSISLQQPAMDRVFNTRSTADVLISVARGEPATAGRYPMADYRSWLISRFPGGATAFGAALARGMASGAPMQSAAPARQAPAAPTAAPLEGQQGDFYFVVYPSPVLGGDGRGGNKPWLQELADPVSKIAWQSWIEIHPTAAQRLGIQNGDHVQVQTAAGTVTAPAFVYLGVRPDVVAMATGRGHTAYGRYAQNIGVNAFDALPVAHDAGGALALTTVKATVTKAAGHSPLVTTEGSARQHGRGIGQAILASQLDSPPAEEAHHFAGDKEHEFLPGLRSPVANDAQGVLGSPTSNNKGMYDPEHWSGMASRRWAMTIDLARCTGCSACVTACYAENNIPTVGAPWQGRSLRPFHTSDGAGWDTNPGANILKGREMTWLRIERYFEGGEDGSTDFDTRFVPMLCQHCGNAPCEPVCPVYATYHSPDGLNVQVYNRCVGTRYCSNGCPYKVRYFNWHGYGEPARRQYAFPEPLNWQLNPDVTVRGKGVMEKCTFCVQRIREAEHRATLEGRAVAPDEFTTACAQACPSRAIVFGDAADENWSVARLAEDRRAYHVFEELNTFTAVVYLKKVNHPAAANANTSAAPPPPVPAPQPAGGAR